MKSDQQEQQLWARFVDLRRADSRHVPAFADVARPAIWRGGRQAVRWAAAAAMVAVIGGMTFWMAAPDPAKTATAEWPEVALELPEVPAAVPEGVLGEATAGAMGGAEWASPTDALLVMSVGEVAPATSRGAEGQRDL
jgi:hypothetical protein